MEWRHCTLRWMGLMINLDLEFTRRCTSGCIREGTSRRIKWREQTVLQNGRDLSSWNEQLPTSPPLQHWTTVAGPLSLYGLYAILVKPLYHSYTHTHAYTHKHVHTVHACAHTQTPVLRNVPGQNDFYHLKSPICRFIGSQFVETGVVIAETEPTRR